MRAVKVSPWFASLAIVSLVLLSTTYGAEDKGFEGYNKRLTTDERKKILDDMKERRIKEVCTPASPSGQTKAFPTLPKNFITQMDISYQDNYTLITGVEKFDGLLNAGKLKYTLAEGIFLTRPNAFSNIIFYSLPGNAVDFIFGNTACYDEGGENCDPVKTCFTGDVPSLAEELKYLFSFDDPNPDQGFMGATSILQWGPTHGFIDKGITDCRAMQCQHFETCIKKGSGIEDMLTITYYFSSPDWTLNNNHNQVPVAIEVMSAGTVSPFLRPIMLRIDFYNFLYDVKPNTNALTPPVDVYCYGREIILEPPRVPHYFAYKSESVTGFDILLPDGDNETKVVTFTTVINQEEYYDWNAKISTAEFIPWFISTEENRWEFRTYNVHDFNQGLEYSLQKNFGTCQVRLLENITSIGDIVVNPDGSVQMRPPWIFEDMDEPMQYNGVHWTRGIPADVWIGTKKLPLGIFNETIVWYYASPFVDDHDVGRRSGYARDTPEFISLDRVPVRVEKYLNLFGSLPHAVQNIYAYEDQPPMTHTIDISPCYDDSQMISYVFDLPGDTLVKVRHFRDKLMYATLTTLAEFGQVSPLRINRLVLEERSNALRVIFTILDRPKVEGDGSNADLESSMQEAAQKINHGLWKKQITIMVPMSVEYLGRRPIEPVYIPITPLSSNLRSIDRQSISKYKVTEKDGFSSGSMAGLAIGMLIVGGLVGAVVCMILRKHNATSSGLPRVSMAKKSSEMPGGSVYLGGDMSGNSDI